MGVLVLNFTLNGLSWTVVAIIIFIYAAFALRTARRSSSNVARYFSLAGLIAGVGLLAYGVGAFSLDSEVVFWTGYLGFLIVDLGLIINVQVAFTRLKNKSLVKIINSVLVVAWLLTAWVVYSGLTIEFTPHLANRVLSTEAALIRAAFLVATLYPVGLMFLLRARTYASRKQTVRSMAMGMTYLIITTSAGFNYIIGQNRDTLISSIIILISISLWAIVIFSGITRKKPY